MVLYNYNIVLLTGKSALDLSFLFHCFKINLYYHSKIKHSRILEILVQDLFLHRLLKCFKANTYLLNTLCTRAHLHSCEVVQTYCRAVKILLQGTEPADFRAISVKNYFTAFIYFLFVRVFVRRSNIHTHSYHISNFEFIPIRRGFTVFHKMPVGPLVAKTLFPT